jgi:hypothetical protein
VQSLTLIHYVRAADADAPPARRERLRRTRLFTDRRAAARFLLLLWRSGHWRLLREEEIHVVGHVFVRRYPF